VFRYVTIIYFRSSVIEKSLLREKKLFDPTKMSPIGFRTMEFREC